MIAAGRGGSIVNVSSQAALVALDGHASYAASTAGLDGITRVAAYELGRGRSRHRRRDETQAPSALKVFMHKLRG